MKLMLTSFGIAEPQQDLIEHQKAPSLFYRMPPVSLRGLTNTFLPDYTTLLLYDKLILDETSFQMLYDEPDPLYSKMAETISLLRREGFVELIDYQSILKQNDFLYQEMLKNDLKFMDQWVQPLKDSVNIWMNFTSKARNLVSQNWETLNPPTRAGTYFAPNIDQAEMENLSMITHIVNNHAGAVRVRAMQALHSSRKRRKREYREALRTTLRSYLSNVNANLVISNELGIGFHDWADLAPFYQKKFLYVGEQETDALQKSRASQKLFELSFPEFAVNEPAKFLKIVQDKRIEDLRQLVADSVDGKVEFDNTFAKTVLKEVLHSERRVSRYRNIVSYVTIPVGFIPWVGFAIQKAIEEGAGLAIKQKLQKEHRWFYLFSEVTDNPSLKKISDY